MLLLYELYHIGSCSAHAHIHTHTHTPERSLVITPFQIVLNYLWKTHTSQDVATPANMSPVLRTVVLLSLSSFFFFFFFFSISKFLALLRCFGRGLTAPGTDEKALQISNQQEKDKERGGKKEENSRGLDNREMAGTACVNMMT